MEKRDSEKCPPVSSPVQCSPNASANNPLYCSYVDGQFTYKDPNTNNQYVWNEGEKKWVVKENTQEVDSNKLEGSGGAEVISPGSSNVHFDGENYTYTDQDGTVFLWDAAKGAWFPKEPPKLESIESSSFSLPPSPPDLSTCTSSQTLGFFNPNYATSLTSPTTTTSGSSNDRDAANSSRRFYYASLSPTSMGVNDQPGLFLSPDDQVNNNDQVVEDSLPPGWEKHDDTNGPYYWHIKSGTIQREKPNVNSPVNNSVITQINNPALMIPGGMSGFVRRSNTMGGFSTATPSNPSNADKRRSWVNYLEDQKIETPVALNTVSNIPAYEFDKHTLKFAAVSLGCLSISEEDLTPERSSRAVSKVIAELTNPNCKVEHRERNGSELASRMWTHTEGSSPTQMFLELTDSHLRVKVHREAHGPLTVLEQPIHSIRVWGVGREDPRDFAFVAREKQTRQFLCHVFRLDMYARPLASSLRDACKKIMIERNARERGNNKRPTSLGLKKNNNEVKSSGGGGATGVGGLLFPTPMDEPRKVIKAFYLGSKSVCKPTGMDVLNNAIDVMKQQGVEKIPVLVSVAPSVIGITSTESDPKVQIEVRVRFLSFMGIGSDIRTCGVIIHTARDDFEAHCFYSTPSTGALCKAIEAACVLRYQKCLDAHHTHTEACAGGPNKEQKPPERENSATSSTATSPKSVLIASQTASNLASALKTVFSGFGKLDEEFLVKYQLSYGSMTEVKQEPDKVPDNKKSTEASSSSATGKKAPSKPEWFELDDTQNTHVYVSNMPTDIDEEEFVTFMSKCGLVMKDVTSGAWKVKLYRDKDGRPKGDGVCTYIKVDSVELALNILDGSYFKSNIVHVERAKFQQKGDYDPTRKPKQKKRRDKMKVKKAQEALFSWKPEKLKGQRGKNERVVIVKHAFHPDEFNEHVELILELKDDFKEEAAKFGECRKVDLFDNNVEGAMKIVMSSPEAADAVVNNFNGRYFGGRKLEAYIWDGFEKLNIQETEAEKAKRLEKWEKYVENDEPESKVAKLDAPPTPPDAQGSSDDDKAYDED